MAYNWLPTVEKSMSDTNGQESHTANIGNGKTVTVTIIDCIRKSGCEKWVVTGVCSDGRMMQLAVGKSDQPDKMKVAETVVRNFM
jgi:hypothetical protein